MALNGIPSSLTTLGSTAGAPPDCRHWNRGATDIADFLGNGSRVSSDERWRMKSTSDATSDREPSQVFYEPAIARSIQPVLHAGFAGAACKSERRVVARWRWRELSQSVSFSGLCRPRHASLACRGLQRAGEVLKPPVERAHPPFECTFLATRRVVDKLPSRVYKGHRR
jgi:hypothetical protein